MQTNTHNKLCTGQVIINYKFIITIATNDNLIVDIYFVNILTIDIFTRTSIGIVAIVNATKRLHIVRLQHGLLRQARTTQFPMVNNAFGGRQYTFRRSLRLDRH